MRYARISASEDQDVTLIRARKHIHLLKPVSHTDMQATTLYSMPMQAGIRSTLINRSLFGSYVVWDNGMTHALCSNQLASHAQNAVWGYGMIHALCSDFCQRSAGCHIDQGKEAHSPA